MEFAGWLAACLGFSLALAGSIKRVPAVWYLLSLGLSALYLYCWFTGKLVALPHVLAAGMRSCLPGTAFMVIVMYVGALPDSLWIKRRLQPIRAELSIMGAFLCLGHIVAFGSSYISWVWGWIPPKVAVPLGMALLLVVLLVLLTATSFSALKRWMGGKRWKRVQKLAYVFYGVLFCHLFWFVLARRVPGSAKSTAELVVYGGLFVLYAVLRVIKARADSRASRES